ncbi:hypothetical protein FDG2_0868 [Candidatus Protofrankia californiensis]|uniref:Uncharacterized protein n=1 Tax=Candidatus Protofrankia californiensis TaxID=1839754 RepID=A0A1C3NUH0_9ACTN|nr:hypothetical protein FDG2_0868 [Candidatus Protofrankia californiensis]
MGVRGALRADPAARPGVGRRGAGGLRSGQAGCGLLTAAGVAPVPRIDGQAGAGAVPDRRGHLRRRRRAGMDDRGRRQGTAEVGVGAAGVRPAATGTGWRLVARGRTAAGKRTDSTAYSAQPACRAWRSAACAFSNASTISVTCRPSPSNRTRPKTCASLLMTVAPRADPLFVICLVPVTKSVDQMTRRPCRQPRTFGTLMMQSVTSLPGRCDSGARGTNEHLRVAMASSGMEIENGAIADHSRPARCRWSSAWRNW